MSVATGIEEDCIGLVGLGPMGMGLAKNLCANGIGAVGWDKDPSTSPVDADVSDPGFRIVGSLDAIAPALERPRAILLAVPSGAPVDDVLDALLGQLAPGDVIADCGNSFFKDTERRALRLKDAGMGYLGLGVSGGPEGARTGPSIMAGGDEAAWSLLRPVLESIAAKVDGVPCSAYFGEGGAGHFVKMVHNGIEYAVMQLLMEVYAALTAAIPANHHAVKQALLDLNTGLNESYLLGATAAVVAGRVPGDGAFLIDVVEDAVGHKGTGQWSVSTALEQGVPVPTLAEAVMYRFLSRDADSVRQTSNPVPERAHRPADYMTALPGALTAAVLSSFAQGHRIFASCESSLHHRLDQREILRTWRGGCILQGKLVEFLWHAAENQPTDGDLLNWPQVETIVEQTRGSLGALVAACAAAGIPCPGLASALAYIGSRTGSRLPTTVLQLQRDYFGQHGLHDKRTGRAIDVNWRGTDDDG